jgi:hypothetical protein
VDYRSDRSVLAPLEGPGWRNKIHFALPNDRSRQIKNDLVFPCPARPNDGSESQTDPFPLFAFPFSRFRPREFDANRSGRKPGPYRPTRREPAEIEEQNSGKNVNAADQTGSLEPGKSADIIAVQDDPLSDGTVLKGLLHHERRKSSQTGAVVRPSPKIID